MTKTLIELNTAKNHSLYNLSSTDYAFSIHRLTYQFDLKMQFNSFFLFI